jgi:YesN/AraC family two-component response regulator
MSNNSFSVIVVDDERLIAKNIAKNIERCNPSFHVISIVHNGEDALKQIREFKPAFLFTDIRMPVMDGLRLIEEAKKTAPLLNCIIISGYDDFEYAKKAIQFGVTDYLLKPVNSDELTQLLSKLEKDILAKKENFHSSSNSKNYTTEEIVQLVENYIQKNYSSALDLETLSETLGFSSSYLTKIFTKYMGTTPSKYIRTYRMSIAQQLLANSEMSINDIAYSVGYTDPFHFSKSFKSETGVTPTIFRNKHI